MGNALCVRMCCVRVWGLEVDEAKAFCGLSALLVGGVLQGNVFVFGFVLFVWHAVGCLEQHGCCSIDHPLIIRTFCWLRPLNVGRIWLGVVCGVVCCVRTV